MHSSASRVFPMPGAPKTVTRCGLASASGTFEGIHHLLELALAPDDRSLEAAEQRRRLGIHVLDDPGAVEDETGGGVTHEPPCAHPGEHPPRSRPVAQARGLVDGRAGHERVAGHHLAGREADARLGTERDGGARSLQRVLVARRGHAEDGEQPTVSEALDRRAVSLEDALGRGASFSQLGPPRLRIVGEAVERDIGGEHGDGLAGLRWREPRRRTLGDRRRVESRISIQYGAVCLLKLAGRLCPELVDERPPGPRDTTGARPPAAPNGRARP